MSDQELVFKPNSVPQTQKARLQSFAGFLAHIDQQPAGFWGPIALRILHTPFEICLAFREQLPHAAALPQVMYGSMIQSCERLGSRRMPTETCASHPNSACENTHMSRKFHRCFQACLLELFACVQACLPRKSLRLWPLPPEPRAGHPFLVRLASLWRRAFALGSGDLERTRPVTLHPFELRV